MGSQTFKAKRGTLWQFDPDDLIVIGHDTKDGPEHELYDERIKLPLNEEMILNLMAEGVKVSVLVRKGAKGKPEIADGRRRVLHAREANKRLKKAGEPLIVIPAILEHGDELHMANVAIGLNEIRHDDDTMVKAAKAVRLLQRNGNDKKATALAFGVTTTTIKNWTKLIELAPAVRKAVAANEIAPSAAIQLADLDKDEQISALKKLKSGAKKEGKKRATTNSAKKSQGKATAPGKRILKKLVEDEDLSASLDPGIIHGLKLALGMYIPGKTTKMGKVLLKAGYTY